PATTVFTVVLSVHFPFRQVVLKVLLKTNPTSIVVQPAGSADMQASVVVQVWSMCRPSCWPSAISTPLSSMSAVLTPILMSPVLAPTWTLAAPFGPKVTTWAGWVLLVRTGGWQAKRGLAPVVMSFPRGTQALYAVT